MNEVSNLELIAGYALVAILIIGIAVCASPIWILCLLSMLPEVIAIIFVSSIFFNLVIQSVERLPIKQSLSKSFICMVVLLIMCLFACFVLGVMLQYLQRIINEDISCSFDCSPIICGLYFGATPIISARILSWILFAKRGFVKLWLGLLVVTLIWAALNQLLVPYTSWALPSL